MIDPRKIEIQEYVARLVDSQCSWGYISTVVHSNYGSEYLQFAYAIYIKKHGDPSSHSKNENSNLSSMAEPINTPEQLKPDRSDKMFQHDTSTMLKKNRQFIYLAPVNISSISANILMTTLSLLVLALLFPPWYIVIEGSMSISRGYYFIADTHVKGQAIGMVNVPLLFCEFFVIIVGGAIALLMVRKNEQNVETG